MIAAITERQMRMCRFITRWTDRTFTGKTKRGASDFIDAYKAEAFKRRDDCLDAMLTMPDSAKGWG